MNYANVPYYHGSLSRQEVLSALTNKKDGSFILRKSASSNDAFAISVVCNGRVLHYSIQYCEGSDYYSLDQHSTFQSPVEACEHYMREQGSLKTKLLHPISFDGSGSSSSGGGRSSPQDTFLTSQNRSHEQQEWFYGDITREEEATRLTAAYSQCRQDGIYLVRQKDATTFVLCLLFEGQPRRYKITYDMDSQRYFINGRSKTFEFIEELLNYYKDPSSDGLVCRLVTPCARSAAPPKPPSRQASAPSLHQKQETSLTQKKIRSLSQSFTQGLSQGLTQGFSLSQKFFISLASPLTSIMPKNLLDLTWSDSQDDSAKPSTINVLASASVQSSEPIIRSVLSRYRPTSLAKDCIGYTSPYRNINVSSPGGIAPDMYVKHKDIKVDRVIGHGHFGTVNLGVCKILGEATPCAVKTLTGRDVLENKREILHEAAVMQKLDHPYIVRLLAICDDSVVSEDLMIVLEFAPLGDMLSFVRTHTENSFPAKRLVALMTQVCDGMAYLASKCVVHRDLAARNILLVSENFAKISDFGMSRIMHESKNYYQAAHPGLWPIRWYPPEVFSDYKFSSKGDVWSFGVAMWEVFSYGKKPYDKMRGCDVLMMIHTGKRLAPPDECPKDVYQLMIKCWFEKPEDRPGFDELLPMLQQLV